MEAITVGLVLALVWKLVDFAKFALARDGNAVITQLTVWVSAFFVVLLAANADLTSDLDFIGGRSIGTLNLPSLILAGLLIGSGASGTVDLKKAIDGTDSAAVPPLTALDRPPRD